MKPRFHRSVLTTGLALLSSALVASANLVTYQVNMGVQIELGNFNPGNGDLVRVAGTFTAPDWITTSVLAPSSGDPNIYEGTFNNDVAATEFENHRFIIDVGGGGTTLNWETSNLRFFQVTAGDQILPVVFYNDVTSANSLVVTQVTFSVNMGVQDSLNNFDPATDFVYVAGDAFNNNWNAGAQVLTNSLVNPEIWTGTFEITNTVGATVNYKFIMNTFLAGVTWENNGVGPGGAQNRQFIFTNETTNLPEVYFNNITPTSTLVATQVTFKVNLAAQIARGEFDPNFGTVTVAGDAFNNNWSAVAQSLTQTPTNSSVWSGTFEITNTVGALVNYKFVLSGATWENDGVGPNGIQNRQFAFTNETTVLPDVHFNNLGNLGALTISPVTAGEVTLNWTGGPLIRVQTNAPLTGVWGDVPETLGASTANVSVGSGNVYFRLIGP